MSGNINAMDVWVTVPGYDPFYTTKLGAAIINQDNQRVAELLADPDIDVDAHDGLALREAALGNNADAVRMLIAAGADLGRDGGAAIQLAIQQGYIELAEEMKQAAARNGQEPDVDIPQAAPPMTPVSNINDRNVHATLPSGERVLTTPLGAAVINGDLKRIDELLAHPDIQVDAHDGLALKESALAGNQAVVEKLIEGGANVSIDNGAAIILAQQAGHSQIVAQLQAAARGESYTPPQPAPPTAGDINALSQSAFIEGYGSVDATALSKAVIENDMDRVREILQNPDLQIDAHDGLALREAVANGLPEMVRVLVEAGADAAQSDSDMLKLAVQNFEPNDEVIMALIEGGADPSVITPEMLDRWPAAAQDFCSYGFLQEYGGSAAAPRPQNDPEQEAAIGACRPGLSAPQL